MATKRQNSTRRAVPSSRVAASNGRLSPVHKPAETDPKKRAAAIKRAGSIVKTTAQIDTITLGRD